MFRSKQSAAFFISIIAVLLITVCICVSLATCSGSELSIDISYYFVCYRTADNTVSASSLSGTASSYGGAGYILCYDDKYYITVSCYYKQKDAESVNASLNRRDLDCSVLAIELDSLNLQSNSAKNNAELYKGNINTLHSLSILAYECANNVDTGQFNQTKAKDVITAINTGLKGLLKANPNNCFTHNIEKLIAECEDKSDGYLYSKDIRYLQIAIIDVIINTILI